MTKDYNGFVIPLKWNRICDDMICAKVTDLPLLEKLFYLYTRTVDHGAPFILYVREGNLLMELRNKYELESTLKDATVMIHGVCKDKDIENICLKLEENGTYSLVSKKHYNDECVVSMNVDWSLDENNNKVAKHTELKAIKNTAADISKKIIAEFENNENITTINVQSVDDSISIKKRNDSNFDIRVLINGVERGRKVEKTRMACVLFNVLSKR